MDQPPHLLNNLSSLITTRGISSSLLKTELSIDILPATRALWCQRSTSTRKISSKTPCPVGIKGASSNGSKNLNLEKKLQSLRMLQKQPTCQELTNYRPASGTQVKPQNHWTNTAPTLPSTMPSSITTTIRPIPSKCHPTKNIRPHSPPRCTPNLSQCRSWIKISE